MQKMILPALLLSVFTSAQAITPQADGEVQQLLSFVGKSQCTFIRSGSSYSAKEAQDHLSMKYGKAKDKISSSEDFINEVASKSYLTGKPYSVQCPKTSEQPAKNWLNTELKRLRGAQKS
ncbi:DUF5329 domain-containing protein [Chitinibacter fontanus]|uniref:DUF5329 domain-containing protein n=1 Tax=Chitinibacter fontanus TaxID=1737446 RepID=A0A7D5ZFK3_9NEIS|nr:DUF5329 domain-containing protein [Chitinibacter fontanus]QLI80949.1 DUF5329 domain-containing protein [Chitinibacter fontanus]